jgi:hypothetical protein
VGSPLPGVGGGLKISEPIAPGGEPSTDPPVQGSGSEIDGIAASVTELPGPSALGASAAPGGKETSPGAGSPTPR